MNTRTSQGLLSWVYKDVLINPDGHAEQELITEYDVPMHNIVMMASTPCVESYNGKVEEGVRVVVELLSGRRIVMTMLKADYEDMRRVLSSNRSEYLGVIRSLIHLLYFGGDRIEF